MESPFLTDDEIVERKRLRKTLVTSLRLFAEYYGWRVMLRALDDATREVKLEYERRTYNAVHQPHERTDVLPGGCSS